MVKLTASVRRGLQLWAMHCQSIMNDKEIEREENGNSEYTDKELQAMRDAIAFMRSRKATKAKGGA